MINPNSTIGRFFGIVRSWQAYLNILYVLLAFPLGVFYFVFLVTGLSLGISLSIIWVGVPILLLVGGVWWRLGVIERTMAKHWLIVQLPALVYPSHRDVGLWQRMRAYLNHPFTWKSLFYLFLKFPLGMATFVVLITFVSLTLAFLSMPFVYESLEHFKVGVFIGPGLPAWNIDSIQEALLAFLVGLALWPASLHVIRGLAWVHGWFARLMLGENQVRGITAIV